MTRIMKLASAMILPTVAAVLAAAAPLPPKVRVAAPLERETADYDFAGAVEPFEDLSGGEDAQDTVDCLVQLGAVIDPVGVPDESRIVREARYP